MQEIWSRACQHYDVPEDVTQTWYARIQQRLSAVSPTRVYHNWDEMLQRKQEHLQHLKPCLVLAAFFQYYQYEGNRNCVKENCLAFEEFSRDALLEDESSKCLILKLLGDKSIDSELTTDCFEEDANLLQDLDLVILAAAAKDYKRYTQLLRREYASMNDEHYKLMRLKVLETLLLIPNIFSTAQFQAQYEEAARQNIRTEIEELKA